MATFQDLINVVETAQLTPKQQILTENSKTYKQMMTNVLQQIGTYGTESDLQQANERIRETVKTYQRSDRIIWALRLVRVDLIANLRSIINNNKEIDDDTKEAAGEWAKKAYIKTRNEYAKNGVPTEALAQAVQSFRTSHTQNTFKHFISYTDRDSDNYIQALDAVTWTWQTPNKLENELEQFEREWQENRERELDHPDEMYGLAKKLIDFGDGFSWWNLNEEYCTKEGSAMGHCGNNQGRSGSGDRVLSLRQDVTRAGKVKQIPYLTFILDNDNRLGEMKGRNNTKPASRYHPYITKLLMSKFIEGIKGGGHDPANNFSLSDLPDDEHKRIIDAKPELAGLVEIYGLEGMTEKVEKLLTEHLRENNFGEIYDIDRDAKEIILVSFADDEELSNEIYWKAFSEYLKAREDASDDVDDFDEEQIHAVKIPEDVIREIVAVLPDDYGRRIGTDLGIDGNPSSYKVQDRIADNFRNSKYLDLMNLGVLTVYREDHGVTSISDENWNKYRNAMMNIILYNIHQHMYLRINETGSELRIGYDNFINGVDVTDDEEDYNEYTLPKGDWLSSFDTYQADEALNTLANDNDKYEEYTDIDPDRILHKMKSVISGDVDVGDTVNYDKLDIHQVAKWFQKQIDVRESVDEQNANIALIKRMAGV